MSVSAVGGGGMGIDRILQMRQQILERNEALSRASANPAPVSAPQGTGQAQPTSFAASLEQALQGVNAQQTKAGALSESYERGETIDIAKVMLARQEASVGFEATLQVRNKLLSAYKDIMSMPV
ncbi:flagellar hook-basal body complex protein FliE [Sphingomonas aracearum]|uniref:Flagellar hook-basal body complex protein FliE n=1 Tax=Sphingomonas aracearum TaxID=2283317 RepID=A0A369VW78_9SPHN|nr:flagellar hook-basal body complex protein FliE [Sphingomonas aracearum]RDE05895.1 flagellar hook-basal body complex protein FliE [Sphingomonas aracearum]